MYIYIIYYLEFRDKDVGKENYDSTYDLNFNQRHYCQFVSTGLRQLG